MGESKEVVAERMRRYRLKKKGVAVEDIPVVVAGPILEMKDGKAVAVRDRLETAGAVHPVVLKMFADLEKRIERMERRLESRESATRSAVGVGDDLFSKVMAEKSKRLGGR
jgi:hypothetical protein